MQCLQKCQNWAQRKQECDEIARMTGTSIEEAQLLWQQARDRSSQPTTTNRISAAIQLWGSKEYQAATATKGQEDTPDRNGRGSGCQENNGPRREEGDDEDAHGQAHRAGGTKRTQRGTPAASENPRERNSRVTGSPATQSAKDEGRKEAVATAGTNDSTDGQGRRREGCNDSDETNGGTTKTADPANKRSNCGECDDEDQQSKGGKNTQRVKGSSGAEGNLMPPLDLLGGVNGLQV